MIPTRLADLARNRAIRATVLVSPLMLLGGCNAVVLFPAGDVALQQRDLLIAATLLMLLIGTLLTAIRFTTAPGQRSETTPQ